MAELQDRLQTALGAAYRLEKELGGGGMSRVFVALETDLGRKVVVKVLPPEMAAGVNADRFRREIQLAASLQHPHIVPLLHAGRTDDLVWYTMPLVEGESLRAKLAREGELPVGEAVRILRDVADALAYAHQHGVVHRDIKPDNVLISGHHAVVTDFGVAKALSEATGATSLTSLGVALGTPAYMAPEQAAADPHVDHRADLYALGALAYEMLTGRPPFTGTSPQQVLAAQVTQSPEPITQHRAAVPPGLAALVMRCLEKKPADRWQQATEVHTQLEGMATPSGGMPPTGAQAPVSSGTEAAIRRGHPARVAALFALAAVGVLALVYLLVRQLGLPDWVFAAAVGLLAAGLPIMVVTGIVERRRAIARTGAQVTTPPTGGLHGWLTWRKALIGGGAGFGVLGLGTAVYMAMRLLGIGPVGTLVASGVLASRDPLIVADFENRTADSGLGPSVTEAFRIDLAQSPVVRVLDQGAIGQVLRRMNREPGGPLAVALAREIAEREGMKAVVAGDIGTLGRGFVVSARLLSPADGAELVVARETADDDAGLIAAVDRLSKRLRERIGESLKTIRVDQPLAEVTTGSLEALRRYSQALGAERQGQLERAAALLEEAVTIDTGFAMAYRKLAVVLGNSGAPQSQVIAATTSAFRFRDRLPALERHLATAYYYSNVEYDRSKVVGAYRSALDVAPDNRISLNNLSLELSGMRQYAAAESLLRRAIAGGGISQNYTNLAYAQVAQGMLDSVPATIDAFARAIPGHPQILFLRAGLAAARFQYDSSERYAREIAAAEKDSPNWQLFATFTQASLDLVRGKLAAVDRGAAAVLALAERSGNRGLVLNAALGPAWLDARFRGAPEAGIRTVEAALRRYPLASIPAVDRPYGTLADFYATVGRPDRARQYRAEYEAAVPTAQRQGPGHFWWDARIAMAEGRPRDAVTAYRAMYDEIGCGNCLLYELGEAYERAGEKDSALAVYERAVTIPDMGRLGNDGPRLGPTYKRLGELYEDRGNRQRALDYYGKFLDLWKDADAELQPVVRDVRQRVARLAGEK